MAVENGGAVMQYCNIQDEGTAVTLRLRGRWTIFALPDIEKELAAFRPPRGARVIIDGEGLTAFDTAAAWFLNELGVALKQSADGTDMRRFKDAHARVLDKIARLPRDAAAPPPRENALRAAVAGFGRHMTGIGDDLKGGIGFLGAFLVALGARLLRPQHLRPQSVVFHINEIGVKAMPIIAL
ncbi:MAG: STAS domain-containing protein, partial [Alphaproteobacteria bacterium]|nr:STAS domain-containing protein [Alphaproteobacteria bacterium]